MSDDRDGYGPTPASSGPAGPGPVPPPAPQPRRGATDGFFEAIRRWGITRSSDRWVGGVAGGLARRFGVDPLLIRGAVGVTMLMGFGFVLYGLAWALLPEESDGRIHLEEALHGAFDVALLGAILLVLIGSQAGDWWFGWGPFDSGWFPTLAWIAAVVAVIAILRNARHHRTGSAPPRFPTPSGPADAPRTEGSTTTMPVTDPRPAATQPSPPQTQAAAPTSAGRQHPGQAYAGQQHAGQQYPGQPQQGASSASAGGAVPPPGRGWAPPPVTPPRPSKPPKPFVRGPGSAITGVVVALVLIGLAALLLADRTGVYDGPIAAVALGGGVVLVGLAIVVSGLRGRRAGGLTALAIIGVIVALPTAVGSSSAWWEHQDRRVVSDQDLVVTSRVDAAAGYSFGIGDATLDLTDLPLTGDTLTVPISAGIGDVTIEVPSGIALRADVTSGAGEITWEVDGQSQTSSGIGQNRTFSSDVLAEGQQADLVLSIDLGLGSVTIEED
ncbi:MAG TPA: PspC domain-containing protein [Cellulomonas sp.]